MIPTNTTIKIEILLYVIQIIGYYSILFTFIVSSALNIVCSFVIYNVNKNKSLNKNTKFYNLLLIKTLAEALLCLVAIGWYLSKDYI